MNADEQKAFKLGAYKILNSPLYQNNEHLENRCLTRLSEAIHALEAHE